MANALQQHLIAFYQGITETYLKDLRHLSDEQISASPMGAARSPLEYTAECIGLNTMIAKTLHGQPVEMPSEEQRAAFYAAFDSYDKVAAGLRDSVGHIVSALEKFSDDQLAEERHFFRGPMKLSDIANLGAMHLVYHDGQTNYVQTLYGDVENHW